MKPNEKMVHFQFIVKKYQHFIQFTSSQLLPSSWITVFTVSPKNFKKFKQQNINTTFN